MFKHVYTYVLTHVYTFIYTYVCTHAYTHVCTCGVYYVYTYVLILIKLQRNEPSQPSDLEDLEVENSSDL